MNVRFIRRRSSVSRRPSFSRGLSFRRSSNPDASAAYHHGNKGANNNARPSLIRRSSSLLRASFAARTEDSSDAEDDGAVEAVDPAAHSLAVQAAEGAKASFRGSLVIKTAGIAWRRFAR